MTKKILTIIAMCLGTFMCLLGETIMNITLPEIQSNLNTSLAGMTWAINAYTILFAALTIPFGKLAERIGIQKAFMGGLLVFLIGSIISATSQDINILILGRIVQSFGVATIFPLSMVIGISTLSLERRMIVVAALGMSQGLAGALGPSIGGILAQYFSWRWIFLINIPMVLITAILCIFSMSFNEKNNASKIDIIGSLLSIIVLGALTLALVQGSDWKWNSPTIIALFALSLVGFLTFLWHEGHIDNPMIPLTLFKHRQFNGAALTILLSTIFFVGVLVVLPTYFIRLQNLSDLSAALLITPAAAMIFIFSPLSAVIVERVGARWIVLIASLSMGIAYFLFWNIDMNIQWQVRLICALLGFGYGLLVGSMQNLAASDFTGDLLSASQPVGVVMRLIGFALAAAIFISALNSNVNNAKVQSIDYAKLKIHQLNLSKEQSNRLEKEVISQISEEKESDSEKYIVSQEEKEKLITQNLEKFPEKTREKVKNTVTIQVLQGIKETEQKINKTIPKIETNTRKQFSKSFINIYKTATPFVFCLLFLVFVFKRKTKSN